MPASFTFANGVNLDFDLVQFLQLFGQLPFSGTSLKSYFGARCEGGVDFAAVGFIGGTTRLDHRLRFGRCGHFRREDARLRGGDKVCTPQPRIPWPTGGCEAVADDFMARGFSADPLFRSQTDRPDPGFAGGRGSSAHERQTTTTTIKPTNVNNDANRTKRRIAILLNDRVTVRGARTLLTEPLDDGGE